MVDINLPNILSASRLAISFLFFIFILSNQPYLQLIALILFVIGSITDYLDGYIARKFNLTSNLGKFLDPLADKFLTTAAFASFVIMNLIPLWMLILVVARDLTTTFMRTKSEKSIITSKIAKIKTTIQMLFIFFTLLLVVYVNFFPLQDLSNKINDFLHSIYYDILMFFIVILTLWTLLDYSKR